MSQPEAFAVTVNKVTAASLHTLTMWPAPQSPMKAAKKTTAGHSGACRQLPGLPVRLGHEKYRSCASTMYRQPPMIWNTVKHHKRNGPDLGRNYQAGTADCCSRELRLHTSPRGGLRSSKAYWDTESRDWSHWTVRGPRTRESFLTTNETERSCSLPMPDTSI